MLCRNQTWGFGLHVLQNGFAEKMAKIKIKKTLSCLPVDRCLDVPDYWRRHHVGQVLVGVVQVPLGELVEVAVGVGGELVLRLKIYHPEKQKGQTLFVCIRRVLRTCFSPAPNIWFLLLLGCLNTGPEHLLRVHPCVGDGGDERLLDCDDVRPVGRQS